MNWNKVGLITTSNGDVSWMVKGAGPAYGKFINSTTLEILMAGRDSENRTRIGRLYYSINDHAILNIEPNPVLNLGELGTFDFNGTSYPWVVEANNETRLYYTGWTKGYHVSFINDVGLAILQEDGQFKKISRATILSRSNDEPFGIGSVCVFKDESDWKMWYTCFATWENSVDPPKHYYHIKYASSIDGIHWDRPNIVAVDFNKDKGEYVTGKPAVIKYRGIYLMWYSYRGTAYKIGLAVSKNGSLWTRCDDESGILSSHYGWDSEMICYGQVIEQENRFYMLYNGNGYGTAGLGLAYLEKNELDDFIDYLKIS